MSRFNQNKDFNGKKGTIVYVDGDFTRALRKFKKKVEESGVLKEVMARQFYEKPTTERKRKKSAAKARWAKKMRGEQLPTRKY